MIYSAAELVTAVAAHIPHFDPTSLLVGAVGSHAIVAGAVRFIAPIPAKAVGMMKDRVNALYAAGAIDAPTFRLLKAVARAAFQWADDEMPDAPGAEKMSAVLDHIAAVPYLGLIVRVDRSGAQEVLQAAYDSIKKEVKTEAADVTKKGTLAPDAINGAPPA